MKTSRGPWQHFFSHEIALRVGINAALVLRYIVDNIERSTVLIEGVQWFRSDDETMHSTFPYLTRGAIHSSIHKLSDHRLLRLGISGHGVRLNQQWISTTPEIIGLARKRNIRIDVDVAAKMGMAAAILIEEIRYKSACSLKYRHPPSPWVSPKPGGLWDAFHLDFAAALNALNAAQLVLSHPLRKNRVRLSTTDAVLAQAERREKRAHAISIE